MNLNATLRLVLKNGFLASGELSPGWSRTMRWVRYSGFGRKMMFRASTARIVNTNWVIQRGSRGRCPPLCAKVKRTTARMASTSAGRAGPTNQPFQVNVKAAA
jgi:hypothetical protein